MCKDLILEKANKILIQKRLEQRKAFHKAKRDNRIIEAGLCPECGEKLITIDCYNEIKKWMQKTGRHYSTNGYEYVRYCPSLLHNHYVHIKEYPYDHDD